MKPECRELERLLAPYIDGETDARQRASVDDHLGACPPCRDRVAAERLARDVVRARRGDLRSCAPDGLRARCAAQRPAAGVTPIASRRPFLGRRAIVPLSLAATLLIAVAGVFLFGLGNPVEALAAQLTVDHVKCFELTAEEKVADAPAAVRRWSEARGWTIGVPPSDESVGLELVGVRRCFSSDGTTAHLMYRWRHEPLSVYIVPRTFRGAGTAQRLVEKLGHGAVIWSDGSRTYLVMTRGRPADFDTVVRYIRARVN